VQRIGGGEGRRPVAARDQLARQLLARDERVVVQRPRLRRAPRGRAQQGHGREDRPRPHGPLPNELEIMTMAGPMTTAMSDGRMQRTSGMVILTDTMAAFSSAFCMRLTRMPSEWMRSARATLVPKMSVWI